MPGYSGAHTGIYPSVAGSGRKFRSPVQVNTMGREKFRRGRPSGWTLTLSSGAVDFHIDGDPEDDKDVLFKAS